jgi:hypothetical protein
MDAVGVVKSRAEAMGRTGLARFSDFVFVKGSFDEDSLTPRTRCPLCFPLTLSPGSCHAKVGASGQGQLHGPSHCRGNGLDL